MSAKNNDKKGRFRSRIVSFRVSEEENELLNRLVYPTGLTKQDYLISRILNKEITVTGNPRVFKRLKTELQEIKEELMRINSLTPNDELFELIQYVAEICERMNSPPAK